jgi:uncharacterized membrane protein
MYNYFNFYKRLDKKLNNVPSLTIGLILITVIATIAYSNFETKEGTGLMAFILMWISSLFGVVMSILVCYAIYSFFNWVKYDFLTAYRETKKELGYRQNKSGKVFFK